METSFKNLKSEAKVNVSMLPTPTTKTSIGVVQSIHKLNVFVDWALKKKSKALIEPESTLGVKSIAHLDFGSVSELLDLMKTSIAIIQSVKIFNVFVESGIPYLMVHQFIELGFNVYIVDGQQISACRGEREKTDAKDVEYIRELYHDKPDLFKPLTETEKADINVRFHMAKYNHFTKDLARFKNRQKAYERQFGEAKAYQTIIKELEQKKKTALKTVLPYLINDIAKFHIHGIGDVLLAQILSAAHPKRFKSLSAYLAFCGYNANVVKTHRFNRTAKTTAHQMAKEMLLQRNETWYPFYLKLKQDLQTRFPENRKAKLNGQAINRLATFLLKEVWKTIKESATSV